MSQFKLRAWNGSRMIYFDLWDTEVGQIICGDDCGEYVEDMPIMRPTGTEDKNKVKIYEGDIVKHEKVCEAPSNYHTGEPAWEEKEYKRLGKITITPSKGVTLSGTVEDWDYNEGTLIEKRRQYGNPGGWDVYSEVIGNIYQNPELLEKSNA